MLSDCKDIVTCGLYKLNDIHLTSRICWMLVKSTYCSLSPMITLLISSSNDIYENSCG